MVTRCVDGIVASLAGAMSGGVGAEGSSQAWGCRRGFADKLRSVPEKVGSVPSDGGARSKRSEPTAFSRLTFAQLSSLSSHQVNTTVISSEFALHLI